MCMKKDIARRLYALLTSFIIILCLVADSISVKAVGITAPILPYVPPESSQIMDIISNAFGVTAPHMEDAEEKMDAYLKIYQGILGTSYDSFKEKLDTIIGKAKTSGKIVIDSSASTIIQQALKQAVTHGYEAGESLPAIDNVQGAISRTQALGINNSAQAWQEIYDKGSRWFSSTWREYGYRYLVAYTPTNIALILIPQRYFVLYGNTLESYIDNSGRRWFVYQENGSTKSFSQILMTYWSIVNESVMEQTGSTNGSVIAESWAVNSVLVDFGVDATAYQTVSAQSQAITEALDTQDVLPVTANTDTADMSGDIVINIPAVTVYPAETVNDLPSVQEKLGVIPTTPDTTAEQLQTIIETLQATQTETYGDVAEYSINLTEYFPFCIPFDIGNILTMFVAEPEAPCVTFNLPVGYDLQDGLIMEEFTLDLSQFDLVALWCRRGMLLVFIVGLAMVTRQIFLRG